MSTYDDRPWLALYPPDVEGELRQRHETMLAVWRAAVVARGEAPCLHAFDTTLTYAEVDTLTDAFAVALQVGGLQSGDRVGVYLQNDPQWPVALIGTWKAGGIAVALNPMLKTRELTDHLNDSGVTVLVCLESLYADVVQHVLPDVPVRRVITTHPADWLDQDTPQHVRHSVGEKAQVAGAEDLRDVVGRFTGRKPEAVDCGRDTVAILTYTSGTTGPPKGAMNTHGNMSYNAQVFAEWFDLGTDEVVLGVAPLFHITGIVAHMATAWYAACPLVLFHRFDAGEALRMIERWRATFVLGAITMYIAMMEHPDAAGHDLSSVSKCGSGGAPVSPATVERFEQITGIYIHNVYGLTETTSPSHLTPLGTHPPVDPRSGALSVGLPVPGCVSRITDVETGEELPVGEIGEIVIAGPMVVPGYWGKPEESRRAIRDDGLHTGDVGFMDEQGWFYIVDRAKDQINASGYKVWPRDVEDVLYRHPAVREAAVVGKPDPYRGETVKAYVSLVAGSAVQPDELIEFCRQDMAAYKYPREIEILSELPKTQTGKLLRRELRAREVQRASEPRPAG
ncbi:MAG: AMP-binding protein [Nitriliruptorales bacterium]|nr:AMP-binding protein [Nitriliruptorales bacterium]